MVNQDRNYFAAAMLALGEADAMITGTTRPFSQSLRQVRLVIDDEPDATPFGDQRHGRPQPHGADRRHCRHRAADRRAICGDRDALLGLRSPDGLGAAGRVHQLHDVRQSAGRPHRGLRGAVELLDGFKADFEYRRRNGAGRGAQLRNAEALLPVHAPLRSGQHPGHARAAVGQHFGEAAARTRRRKRPRPVYARPRASGADRTDDGERVGPGDAGGARRRRCACAAPA